MNFSLLPSNAGRGVQGGRSLLCRGVKGGTPLWGVQGGEPPCVAPPRLVRGASAAENLVLMSHSVFENALFGVHVPLKHDETKGDKNPICLFTHAPNSSPPRWKVVAIFSRCTFRHIESWLIGQEDFKLACLIWVPTYFFIVGFILLLKGYIYTVLLLYTEVFSLGEANSQDWLVRFS